MNSENGGKDWGISDYRAAIDARDDHDANAFVPRGVRNKVPDPAELHRLSAVRDGGVIWRGEG